VNDVEEDDDYYDEEEENVGEGYEGMAHRCPRKRIHSC
jgi:hypothetical protein